MATTKNEKFITKLGTSKKIEKSRIWIQGKRLQAAGFRPGTVYYASWSGGFLALTLDARAGHDEIRKVTGKGDLPIIDIVGSRVVETFGNFGTHVEATFAPGLITFRRATRKSS